MIRQVQWIAAALVGVCVVAETANAQPQPGVIAIPSRPAFSPYLNLLRAGSPAAINYYGIVQPQIQARNAIQNLQSSVQNNQQAIGNLQNGMDELPSTGHQSMFLNHQSYFMTNGGGGFGKRRDGQAAGYQRWTIHAFTQFAQFEALIASASGECRCVLWQTNWSGRESSASLRHAAIPN